MTLTVTLNTNETDAVIKRRLKQVADDAASNGMLTGEGSSTVETWSAEAKKLGSK